MELGAAALPHRVEAVTRSALSCEVAAGIALITLGMDAVSLCSDLVLELTRRWNTRIWIPTCS